MWSGGDSFSFYSVVTRFWEFGAGALLALGAEARRRAPGRITQAAGVMGLVMLLVTLFSHSELTPFPGYHALVPVVGSVLVILSGPVGPVARLLSMRPAVHLGDISYSWYLWHWPVIVIGKRVVGQEPFAILAIVVVSYGFALASYRYVEQRWRHGAGDGRLRRLVPIVPVVLVPALVAGALGLGGQKSWWSESVVASTAELKPNPEKSNVCGGFQGPMSTRDVSQCTWGADRPGDPLYLMGDSNAGQFTEALVAASEELDRPLVVATRGGCPVVDAQTRVGETISPASQECSDWLADAKSWLKEQESGTVVLAAASESIDDESVAVRAPDGRWVDGLDAKERLWKEGSVSGALAVKDAGHQVVVVSPVPHLPGEGRPWWHPAECATVSWFQNDPAACNRDVSTEEYRSEQANGLEAAAESAHAADGVLIDLEEELCPDGSCSAYRDGHWWYRDGLHISTYGSTQLADEFVRGLALS